MPMPYYLLSIFLFSIAVSVAVASPAIRPGQYVRDSASGWLTIRKGGGQKLTFEIESIGGNCHTCSVSGVIQNGIGYADASEDDGADSECRINFSVHRSTLMVESSTPEECHAYCGMRAGIEGSYTIPPAACTDAGRQSQRERSQALYRSREYSQAESVLQTLMNQCSHFMNWIEIDQVRNDLALAEYHNGEPSRCIKTLDATLASEFKDEQELKVGGPNGYLPPCDFDNYIDVARATWFNRALCKQDKSLER